MNIVLILLALLPALSLAAETPPTEAGRRVYAAVCMACHSPSNVMVSAPKAGDVQEWRRRGAAAKGGLDTLTERAIEGVGAMPPKGGRPELTKAEIRAAIEYMQLQNSGAE